MTEPHVVTARQAEDLVSTGSDIVLIPYTSFMEPDGRVRLSVFSEIVTMAGAGLYGAAATSRTQIIAVGEDTYGDDHPSTTALMYDLLEKEGVPASAFAPKRPHRANATPQQIDWLSRHASKAWQNNPPVLIGHVQHWPRIARLCALYGLSAGFTDASLYLNATGRLQPEYRRAGELYRTQGARYETLLNGITRILTPFGRAAVTSIFGALTWLRTPNVVDIQPDAAGNPVLYATTVRRHLHYLQHRTKSGV